jgi:hypothetical protein
MLHLLEPLVVQVKLLLLLVVRVDLLLLLLRLGRLDPGDRHASLYNSQQSKEQQQPSFGTRLETPYGSSLSRKEK